MKFAILINSILQCVQEKTLFMVSLKWYNNYTSKTNVHTWSIHLAINKHLVYDNPPDAAFTLTQSGEEPYH